MLKRSGYKLLNFIKRFWNNKNVQTFVPPFLCSLGPIIGSIAFEWNPVQKFIVKYFYKDFDKWIQMHTGLILILVVFWIPILYITGKWLDYFLAEKINFEWLIATLETLDLPVKRKKSRFGEYAINFLKKKFHIFKLRYISRNYKTSKAVRTINCRLISNI